MTEHPPSLDALPGQDALCHVCGAVQKWIDRDMPNLSHWAECPLHKAAPELLEALEAISNGRTKDGVQRLMDLCAEWKCAPRGQAIPGYTDLVIAVARAAIAKARGG